MIIAITMIFSALSIVISVFTIVYNAANVKRVKAIKQQNNNIDEMKGETHERITAN